MSLYLMRPTKMQEQMKNVNEAVEDVSGVGVFMVGKERLV